MRLLSPPRGPLLRRPPNSCNPILSFPEHQPNQHHAPLAVRPTSPPPSAVAPRVPDLAASKLIRTTLGHYPLSIDGKNFAALALVFAADAVANYSAPLGVLTPLATIQAVLTSGLEKVTTQHALSTQVIEVLSESEAFSVTYYTATHFGMGLYEGEIAVAYGQYQDYWVLRNQSWKIQNRNLVYMGPGIGNLSIFT
ncbi:hypothetical protein C8R45DRAFT_1110126 [Mycena sanguinolenta]|nr:hypothetical protein C8R45DRAFT_1110126 [Mycena sanguinolenta]